MENKTLKTLIVIAVIVYTLAPDLAPGPIDDILVMLLGYMVTAKKERNRIVDVDNIL